jgi:hypothetical protein
MGLDFRWHEFLLGRMLRFVTRTMKSIAIALAMLLTPLVFGSCASSPKRVNDVQQMGQRLQGVWLLKNFAPREPLEPALFTLLSLQFGQMRVSVNGNQITAQGPGLHVLRTYQIQEAFADTATLLVIDQSGIGVRVAVEIHDAWLTIRPMDSPWTGEGLLQRL